MLARFQLEDTFITAANALVAGHWPHATPHHDTNGHVFQSGFSQLLAWSLTHATTVGEVYTTLRVKMTPLTLTLKQQGNLHAAPNKFRFRYHQGFHSGFVTLADRETDLTMPLGMADLHLAHEFAKRLTELQALLPTQAQAAA